MRDRVVKLYRYTFSRFGHNLASKLKITLHNTYLYIAFWADFSIINLCLSLGAMEKHEYTTNKLFCVASY